MPRANRKWRWRIGTTSRAPKGRHYVMLDIDTKALPAFWALGRVRRLVAIKTRNGWHIYTDKRVSWQRWKEIARRSGADPAWVRIAAKRGYAFLADREPVTLGWPVERMRIRWNPLRGGC